MKNFRFYITSETPIVEVFPINADSIIFEFSPRNKGDVVPPLVLNTNLIFNKNDYNFIKSKEENALCDEISIRIDLRCSGVYTPYWYGVFAPAECELDYDRCILNAKVRPKENIQADLKINFLEIPNQGGIDDVYTGTGGGERIYTNCRFFNDVLLYVAQKSNPQINSIISDFFQINPLTVTDQMLPGITNFYKQMLFGALSDIQEPIPSNLATIEWVSFNELMDDLNVLFDVFWYIDSSYNLRIEHRVFFDGVQGLDLTTAYYQKFINGKNKFIYSLDELVKYETWRIIDNRQYCRLIYNACADLTKQKNENNYQTQIIRTDYYNIRYGNGSSNTTGLFLFATDQELGLFRMIEGAGQNIMLMPSVLVNKFHRYGRPDDAANQEYFQFDDGTQTINFNQGQFLAYSVKPIKIQRDLKIPFCCNDDFDYKKQLLTTWGLGYHQNAKIDLNKNTLQFDLKYKIRNDNPNILPTDLPNLDLWLKGDAGVTYNPTTFRVSQWDDYSGNNRHAVQTTGSAQPLFVSGSPFLGAPSVGSIDFSGNRFLKTPSFQTFPIKRGTIFIVHGPIIVSGTFNSILSTNNSAGTSLTEFDISVADTNPDEFISANQGLIYPQYKSPETGAGLYYLNLYDNILINGVQDGLYPINSPASWPNSQPNANPLTIGANSNIAGLATYTLYEVIIYGRNISELERQKIELYLAKKWNLQLYTGI